MRSNTLCLSVSEPTTRLTVQHKPQALHHRLSKQTFVRENEKTSVLKKYVKFLRYTDEFFSDEQLLLESYRLYIIAKYKASHCSKMRPDLPNLFFCFKSIKPAKFPF